MTKIPGGCTLWARQTIDSEIFRYKPDKWFKIWFFIVNRVNHADRQKFARGSCLISYSEIMGATGATRDIVDKCVRWLKSCESATTRKATRGMTITVLKYDLFQDMRNYESDKKSDTEATQKRHRSDTINKNGKNGRMEEPTIASEAPATPRQEATEFFESEPAREAFILSAIESTGATEDFVRAETSRFVGYWTERTHDGKRQKWQTMDTFEVKRRLVTWFTKASSSKFSAKKTYSPPKIV